MTDSGAHGVGLAAGTLVQGVSERSAPRKTGKIGPPRSPPTRHTILAFTSADLSITNRRVESTKTVIHRSSSAMTYPMTGDGRGWVGSPCPFEK